MEPLPISPRAHEPLTAAGFTLIELVVALGIITVITLVALTSQSSFNKSLILTNTAYDVALTIRSAQTYGLGSRNTTVATNAGYGVHFTRGTSSFILFADTNPAPSANNCHGLPASGAGSPDAHPGDCAYTVDDTVIQTYTLQNGMKISDICNYDQDFSQWDCNNTTSIDIIFTRPNSDVSITKNASYYPWEGARIKISSPQGTCRYVTVSSSGQISVSADQCL